MDDTTEQSYITLLEFVLLLKRRIAELGGKHSLTAIQTISILLLRTPQPMHVLRSTFNCDASNVTGIVDGLEQKGMASRYESPTDRRIKMVKLTPDGRRVRTKLLRMACGADGSIHSMLDKSDYDHLIRLIEKTIQRPGE